MTTAARLSLAAALAASAGAAAAAPVVALVGERTLALFDTTDPQEVARVEVSGVSYLLGVDLRPATGELIGVSLEGAIVVIDPATGRATVKSKMDAPPDFSAGRPVVVDVNPAADKLRIMTGTTNHRVDMETGKVTVDGALAFAGGDMHAGETPDIVAAAYSNSFGKPEKTALYDIDATIGALIRQSKPNEGVLEAIGKLGVGKAATLAFDIGTDASGANVAWLAADGALYTVDLATGEATPAGRLGREAAQARDLAILPAR